jgi:hypothetical protein
MCLLFGVRRSKLSDTVLVHNSAMKVAEKAVRQSVSLPPRVAKQVSSLAKSRQLSKNRMLLELIETQRNESSSSSLPWLNVSATSGIRKRRIVWAMNSAEWSSAANAAARALGQLARRSTATSDRADA